MSNLCAGMPGMWKRLSFSCWGRFDICMTFRKRKYRTLHYNRAASTSLLLDVYNAVYENGVNKFDHAGGRSLKVRTYGRTDTLM